jgi:hypothetical protein
VRRHGRHLPGLIGLDAADGDEGVAALLEGLRNEVLELAGLVAAEGQRAVAVLPLRVELDLAAELGAEPLQRLDRRRAEGQGVALEALQVHEFLSKRSRSTGPGGGWAARGHHDACRHSRRSTTRFLSRSLPVAVVTASSQVSPAQVEGAAYGGSICPHTQRTPSEHVAQEPDEYDAWHASVALGWIRHERTAVAAGMREPLWQYLS